MRFVGITLPHRRDRWNSFVDGAAAAGIEPEKFVGVVGKELDLEGFPDTAFDDYFKTHCPGLGHLGATLSHVGVWRDIVARGDTEPVVVFEDDIFIPAGFKKNLNKSIKNTPRHWDVLLLGWTCQYDHYDPCRWNDECELKNGVTPVNYFIGMFGYVVNGARSAQRILDAFFPCKYVVDHWLNKLIQRRDIWVYGCVPNLIFHPGSFRIDSHRYSYDQPVETYESDTNT